MSDDYVTYDELPEIIRGAVRQALEEYEHECVLRLKSGDAEHVRDMVGVFREVGGGDLCKGIIIVRENHKFVMSCHKAATKIGWGVIIMAISVMGTLGLFAAGIWKQTAGGGGG